MPKSVSRLDLRLRGDPKPRPGKRAGALAAEEKRGFALELAFSSPALSEQNIPPWAQLKSPAGLAANPAPEAGADAASFYAGASLALFDARLKESSHFAGAVRQRLALRAATACAERSHLREDSAALRDRVHFLKPGADPGPSGRLHQLWRFLASEPARIEPQLLRTAADSLGVPVKQTSGADEIDRLVTALEKINITIRNPIASAGGSFRATDFRSRASHRFGDFGILGRGSDPRGQTWLAKTGFAPCDRNRGSRLAWRLWQSVGF